MSSAFRRSLRGEERGRDAIIIRAHAVTLPSNPDRQTPSSVRSAPRPGSKIQSQMTQLARKLRVTDYFSLGWGTMVGVGWLVVMDDWLLRGGPLGGILGFTMGSILLLPIGYVYGRLVTAMPDAAGRSEERRVGIEC